MAILAAQSTGGFYESDSHSIIPADAVEITYEYHAELLAGLTHSKVISWLNGKPYLKDMEPPSTEQLAEAAYAEQARLLRIASDIIQPLSYLEQSNALTDHEVVKLQNWREFSVQVSRVDQQPSWPEKPQWPAEPDKVI
ncbi:tail fiber assembly protein [Aeromonas sp. DNRA1]|uniref:tail fiber assembly protein n=1 Tax=Aeromonas TaxID=642 RepID=UPI001459B425|nr:tail fiber assembly protein [Aeromonas sp. DNRA1]NME01781.1 tail fiber assembly protein [Aeromonas sp. DNRA1]